MSQPRQDPIDFSLLDSEGLEALDLGIVQVGADGTVGFANQAACRMFGLSGQDFLRRDFFRDIAPSANMPAFYGRVLEGVRRGRLDESFPFVFGFDPEPIRVQVQIASDREPDRYWIALRVVDRIAPSRHREAVLAVDQRARAEPVDPSLCEREPIHAPGSVQSHTVLLAADPATLTVTACSDNAAEAFDRGAPDLLGRRLGDILPSDLVSAIEPALVDGTLNAPLSLRRVIHLGHEKRPFAVAVHVQADHLVLELEMAPARPEDFGAARPGQIQEAVGRLRRSGTLASAARAAAQDIRALTGFERVLIYRFDADWNGEAIAEAKSPDWDESLLGLLFPASDIPAQARALYTKSHGRFVVDRDAPPAPLLTTPAAGNRPVDLTFAQSRSLSPIHLEYQRNLGVNGSMSLSILVEGRLWGLAIGHHRQPHYVAPDTRAAAAAVADAYALRLHELEVQEQWRQQQAHVAAETSLLHQMAAEDDFVLALSQGPTTLLDLFQATGAAIVRGRSVTALGHTPALKDIETLADWLRQHPPSANAFATDRLSDAYEPAKAYADVASGVLAAFVNGARADLLLWFKPEVVSTVIWGGDPRKPVLAEARSGMVLPRRSFERWVEERRRHSTPWPDWQVRIAETLAAGIEGMALRQSRKIAELSAKQDELVALLLDKERLLAQKDVLTREIDHRVKNSLQIVAAFLQMQGRAVADPAARQAFSETYARVMSVARVHDSLYQSEEVEEVDLGQTIENLCNDLAAGVGGAREIELKAEPGIRVPYKTGVALSLIATELITNAFKYAYAPDVEGGVQVSVRAEAGGGVKLSVCDQGQGLPEDWAMQPSRQGAGLGMKLIRALLDQVGARIETENSPGACFNVFASVPSMERGGAVAG